jgi:nitrite reductase/ring-hydroxylating ferredoxin subunit
VQNVTASPLIVVRQSLCVPAPSLDDIASLVDLDAGTVAGRAFTDDAIYDLELERVFARAWSYLCDPDELEEPGQFVSTFTGEDPVAVVRQSDGSVKAVLNSCRHRGLPVCGLAGQAPRLTCGYHGWTYDLDGRLVGVIDGDEDFRRWAEERRLALVPVTRTVMRGGLLFGTWDAMWDRGDADAHARVEAAAVALRAEGPLTRQRRPIQLDANWKVVVEVLGAVAEAEGGTVLFPSFAVLPESGLVTAVHPKGPDRTEVWVSTAVTTSSDAVDPVRVAIETGLEPEGPRSVVLTLKARAMAPDGCPAVDAPVAIPPRHIQERSATHLYRAWVEHMIDDSPLTGLIAT